MSLTAIAMLEFVDFGHISLEKWLNRWAAFPLDALNFI